MSDARLLCESECAVHLYCIHNCCCRRRPRSVTVVRSVSVWLCYECSNVVAPFTTHIAYCYIYRTEYDIGRGAVDGVRSLALLIRRVLLRHAQPMVAEHADMVMCSVTRTKNSVESDNEIKTKSYLNP